MIVIKRGLYTAGNVLFICFLIIMVIVICLMVKGKLDSGIPSVGPYKLYVVLSGSMSPEFNTGSIIAVTDINSEEVIAGDIITFRKPGDKDTIITHRVVELIEEQGEAKYITRGDVNDCRDADPVPAENIIGQAVYSIAYAGYLTEFADSKKGLLIMVIIPGVLVIINELRNLLKYAAEHDEEEERKKAKTERVETRSSI